MKKITAIFPFHSKETFEKMIRELASFPLVERIFLIVNKEAPDFSEFSDKIVIERGFIASSFTLNAVLSKIKTDYIFILRYPTIVAINIDSLKRFIDVAESTGAGMVYSDFYEDKGHKLIEHPVNDYQPGSIRDDFNFGALMFFSTSAIRRALESYGQLLPFENGALYDLRLKVSIDYPLFHIREFLYTEAKNITSVINKETHFDYVDPHNLFVQKEMEAIATSHLKNIGAYLKPKFKNVPISEQSFPLEASVVIPVFNREKTILDAVQSAVSQKTDFPYNIIVVDNHSKDGTTDILRDITKKYSNVRHIIPSRRDLSIGGCWNEAIRSAECGRYAVQLDSDDLYSRFDTLQRIVDLFRNGDFAMVIGSYTIVNEAFEQIPPGLIDHREWTEENGHNNALRINGLGAPRAFRTDLVRQIGFLNVGYGEDYALALRISREYRIGRIYESLYLCRRWAGNTDAGLSVEHRNRNDAFKDQIRTIEIMARKRQNKEETKDFMATA